MRARWTRRDMLRTAMIGALGALSVPLSAACNAARAASDGGTTIGSVATVGSTATTSPPTPTPVRVPKTGLGPDGVYRVLMTEARRFDPPSVAVLVGSVVEWVNVSAHPHTATGDPAKAKDQKSVFLPERADPWDTGDIMPARSYARVFDVPGFYIYFCKHDEGDGMIGRLIVSPSTARSPKGATT
jgi:plastocyanin